MRLKGRPIFLLIGFRLPLFFTFLLLSLPEKAAAVPQFARRYKVRCSACHTIVPVLNEQGYMFKRLGYHLPPALEDGKLAAFISGLIVMPRHIACAVTAEWSDNNIATRTCTKNDCDLNYHAVDHSWPPEMEDFKIRNMAA